MSTIQVAIRVRPSSDWERSESEDVVTVEEDVVSVHEAGMSDRGLLKRIRARKYAFDYCFGPTSSQEQLFTSLSPILLSAFASNRNGSVIAYGQTGSGKTFTMLGDILYPGLIPRICEACIMDTSTSHSEHFEVSFYEIYNDKVRDLLSAYLLAPSSTPATKLRVREHPTFGPYVQGLSWHHLDSPADLAEILNIGCMARSSSATAFHSSSSRSHAIFTIRRKSGSAKMNFVDLAGSERHHISGTKEQIRETAYINKSLATLGSVILALSSRNGKRPCRHIPYRDSTLTWLLKDSIGGHSKTIMIGTIAPSSKCRAETLNTLRYAHKARHIVNRSSMFDQDTYHGGIDPHSIISDLKAEIARLRAIINAGQKVDADIQVQSTCNGQETSETDDESSLQASAAPFEERGSWSTATTTIERVSRGVMTSPIRSSDEEGSIDLEEALRPPEGVYGPRNEEWFRHHQALNSLIIPPPGRARPTLSSADKYDDFWHDPFLGRPAVRGHHNRSRRADQQTSTDQISDTGPSDSELIAKDLVEEVMDRVVKEFGQVNDILSDSDDALGEATRLGHSLTSSQFPPIKPNGLLRTTSEMNDSSTWTASELLTDPIDSLFLSPALSKKKLSENQNNGKPDTNGFDTDDEVESEKPVKLKGIDTGDPDKLQMNAFANSTVPKSDIHNPFEILKPEPMDHPNNGHSDHTVNLLNGPKDDAWMSETRTRTSEWFFQSDHQRRVSVPDGETQLEDLEELEDPWKPKETNPFSELSVTKFEVVPSEHVEVDQTKEVDSDLDDFFDSTQPTKAFETPFKYHFDTLESSASTILNQSSSTNIPSESSQVKASSSLVPDDIFKQNLKLHLLDEIEDQSPAATPSESTEHKFSLERSSSGRSIERVRSAKKVVRARAELRLLRRDSGTSTSADEVEELDDSLEGTAASKMYGGLMTGGVNRVSSAKAKGSVEKSPETKIKVLEGEPEMKVAEDVDSDWPSYNGDSFDSDKEGEKSALKPEEDDANRLLQSSIFSGSQLAQLKFEAKPKDEDADSVPEEVPTDEEPEAEKPIKEDVTATVGQAVSADSLLSDLSPPANEWSPKMSDIENVEAPMTEHTMKVLDDGLEAVSASYILKRTSIEDAIESAQPSRAEMVGSEERSANVNAMHAHAVDDSPTSVKSIVSDAEIHLPRSQEAQTVLQLQDDGLCDFLAAPGTLSQFSSSGEKTDISGEPIETFHMDSAYGDQHAAHSDSISSEQEAPKQASATKMYAELGSGDESEPEEIARQHRPVSTTSVDSQSSDSLAGKPSWTALMEPGTVSQLDLTKDGLCDFPHPATPEQEPEPESATVKTDFSVFEFTKPLSSSVLESHQKQTSNEENSFFSSLVSKWRSQSSDSPQEATMSVEVNQILTLTSDNLNEELIGRSTSEPTGHGNGHEMASRQLSLDEAKRKQHFGETVTSYMEPTVTMPSSTAEAEEPRQESLILSLNADKDGLSALDDESEQISFRSMLMEADTAAKEARNSEDASAAEHTTKTRPEAPAEDIEDDGTAPPNRDKRATDSHDHLSLDESRTVSHRLSDAMETALAIEQNIEELQSLSVQSIHVTPVVLRQISDNLREFNGDPEQQDAVLEAIEKTPQTPRETKHLGTEDYAIEEKEDIMDIAGPEVPDSESHPAVEMLSSDETKPPESEDPMYSEMDGKKTAEPEKSIKSIINPSHQSDTESIDSLESDRSTKNRPQAEQAQLDDQPEPLSPFSHFMSLVQNLPDSQDYLYSIKEEEDEEQRQAHLHARPYIPPLELDTDEDSLATKTVLRLQHDGLDESDLGLEAKASAAHGEEEAKQKEQNPADPFENSDTSSRESFSDFMDKNSNPMLAGTTVSSSSDITTWYTAKADPSQDSRSVSEKTFYDDMDANENEEIDDLEASLNQSRTGLQPNVDELLESFSSSKGSLQNSFSSKPPLSPMTSIKLDAHSPLESPSSRTRTSQSHVSNSSDFLESSSNMIMASPSKEAKVVQMFRVGSEEILESDSEPEKPANRSNEEAGRLLQENTGMHPQRNATFTVHGHVEGEDDANAIQEDHTFSGQGGRKKPDVDFFDEDTKNPKVPHDDENVGDRNSTQDDLILPRRDGHKKPDDDFFDDGPENPKDSDHDDHANKPHEWSDEEETCVEKKVPLYYCDSDLGEHCILCKPWLLQLQATGLNETTSIPEFAGLLETAAEWWKPESAAVSEEKEREFESDSSRNLKQVEIRREDFFGKSGPVDEAAEDIQAKSEPKDLPEDWTTEKLKREIQEITTESEKWPEEMISDRPSLSPKSPRQLPGRAKGEQSEVGNTDSGFPNALDVVGDWWSPRPANAEDQAKMHTGEEKHEVQETPVGFNANTDSVTSQRSPLASPSHGSPRAIQADESNTEAAPNEESAELSLPIDKLMTKKNGLKYSLKSQSIEECVSSPEEPIEKQLPEEIHEVPEADAVATRHTPEHAQMPAIDTTMQDKMVALGPAILSPVRQIPVAPVGGNSGGRMYANLSDDEDDRLDTFEDIDEQSQASGTSQGQKHKTNEQGLQSPRPDFSTRGQAHDEAPLCFGGSIIQGLGKSLKYDGNDTTLINENLATASLRSGDSQQSNIAMIFSQMEDVLKVTLVNGVPHVSMSTKMEAERQISNTDDEKSDVDSARDEHKANGHVPRSAVEDHGNLHKDEDEDDVEDLFQHLSMNHRPSQGVHPSPNGHIKQNYPDDEIEVDTNGNHEGTGYQEIASFHDFSKPPPTPHNTQDFESDDDFADAIHQDLIGQKHAGDQSQNFIYAAANGNGEIDEDGTDIDDLILEETHDEEPSKLESSGYAYNDYEDEADIKAYTIRLDSDEEQDEDAVDDMQRDSFDEDMQTDEKDHGSAETSPNGHVRKSVSWSDLGRGGALEQGPTVNKSLTPPLKPIIKTKTSPRSDSDSPTASTSRPLQQPQAPPRPPRPTNLFTRPPLNLQDSIVVAKRHAYVGSPNQTVDSGVQTESGASYSRTHAVTSPFPEEPATRSRPPSPTSGESMENLSTYNSQVLLSDLMALVHERDTVLEALEVFLASSTSPALQHFTSASSQRYIHEYAQRLRSTKSELDKRIDELVVHLKQLYLDRQLAESLSWLFSRHSTNLTFKNPPNYRQKLLELRKTLVQTCTDLATTYADSIIYDTFYSAALSGRPDAGASLGKSADLGFYQRMFGDYDADAAPLPRKAKQPLERKRHEESSSGYGHSWDSRVLEEDTRNTNDAEFIGTSLLNEIRELRAVSREAINSGKDALKSSGMVPRRSTPAPSTGVPIAMANGLSPTRPRSMTAEDSRIDAEIASLLRMYRQKLLGVDTKTSRFGNNGF